MVDWGGVIDDGVFDHNGYAPDGPGWRWRGRNQSTRPGRRGLRLPRRRLEQLGPLGSSCNGADSCLNFSTPHLHFAIHRDSQFVSSGGSSGGRAVVPEPVDGYSGLAAGDTLTSHNGGGSVTPPTCDLVIGEVEVLIEKDGPCAQLTGGALDEVAGHGDHAYWTVQGNPAPDYAQGLNWLLTFAGDRSYDLSVYVPSSVSDRSPSAEYKVQYAGQSTKVYVDHSSVADDWLALGTFAFAAGGDQWVRLGDDFAEPAAEGKRIAIDALRVTPSGSCECGSTTATDSRACDDGGEQTRTCDGCHWSAWTACGAGTGGTGAGASSAGGGGVGGGVSANPSSDDGGCACRLKLRAHGRVPAHAAALSVALLLALRRPRAQLRG